MWANVSAHVSYCITFWKLSERGAMSTLQTTISLARVLTTQQAECSVNVY